MADAYGALVFNHSEDAEFDRQAVILVLNQYEWANDGGEWLLTDCNNVFYSERHSQYPTVYTRQEALCVVETAEGQVEKTPNEMSDDDWCNVVDVQDEIVQLAQLRDALLPHIKTGWVQIACTANEKQRYVYMEQLKISAEGKAVRERKCIGAGASYSEEFEEL